MSCVVVGCGPGLGAAVAHRFSAGGYPVALVARKIETVAPLQAAIQAEGRKATAYAADASDEAQVDAAFQAIESELGRVEVLVYNVGGGSWPPPTVEDTSVDMFRKGLEVNAVGAFMWVKKVIGGMKEQQRGTIIMTGATAALRGGARFSAFSPGKFALRSLSQTLARELGPKGVHVAHVIVDGMIDTARIGALAGPSANNDTRISPAAIAEEYWHLHQQPRSAWTQELDLRPYAEKF